MGHLLMAFYGLWRLNYYGQGIFFTYCPKSQPPENKSSKFPREKGGKTMPQTIFTRLFS